MSSCPVLISRDQLKIQIVDRAVCLKRSQIRTRRATSKIKSVDAGRDISLTSAAAYLIIMDLIIFIAGTYIWTNSKLPSASFTVFLAGPRVRLSNLHAKILAVSCHPPFPDTIWALLIFLEHYRTCITID